MANMSPEKIRMPEQAPDVRNKNFEEVEVKVLNEGSMLKKAVVEIYTFANAEERENNPPAL